jgi:hypothetical protein
MTNLIMIPEHPRWNEFAEKLCAVVHSPRDCNHTTQNTGSILTAMGDLDVKASLDSLQSRGGFCDCEVIMNVICSVEETTIDTTVAEIRASDIGYLWSAVQRANGFPVKPMHPWQEQLRQELETLSPPCNHAPHFLRRNRQWTHRFNQCCPQTYEVNKMASKKPKAEENVIPLKIVKPGRLDKFKSKKKPSIGGLETAPTVLGILKIGDTNDFVRLHPDEDLYWSEELCFVSVPVIGDKHDQLHMIDEEIAVRYLPARKIKRFRLALATKPYDVFFLCQVPSVHLDNSWNSTALKACLQAKTHWVQVSSRKEENVEGYKCDKTKDADAFPEPK